jgi:hypothetical protein
METNFLSVPNIIGLRAFVANIYAVTPKKFVILTKILVAALLP